MLKTLLASSAVAAALAAAPAAVMAQSAPADQTAPQTTPSPTAPADTAPGGADTMAPAPIAPDSMAEEPDQGVGEAAMATELGAIPRDELIGAEIKTATDQESVASVEDVLLDADGSVKNLVARFGGFLGFGETTVLLMPDEVTPYRLEDGTVELTTTLTPEALKDRPEYPAPAN